MKIKFWTEFFGTSFLVMIVLGSGVMAQNLFQNQPGPALLVNSMVTGLGLFVLIQSLAPLSGAHLNPMVSFIEWLWGRLKKREMFIYISAQMLGAYSGIVLTHLLFNLPVFVTSSIERSGIHLLYSEVVATFGLITVIALSGRKHAELAPVSIASYIAAAYWFTSSTAFTNPAVTFARMFTNTFGGMAPEYYFPFVIAQMVGAMLAWMVLRFDFIKK